MLSERCVELLDAAATGIMVGDAQGTLHVMAASSERAHLLELFQAQNQEGPCLDAYRSGEAVLNETLGDASPWPHFAPMDIQAGLPSVHAHFRCGCVTASWAPSTSSWPSPDP